MKKIIITLLSTLLLLSLISCEDGESTPYDETMVMYLHAKADSTITGLYLSRTATVNESITMGNLGIDGATIELYEKAPDSVTFAYIGTLDEILESDSHNPRLNNAKTLFHRLLFLDSLYMNIFGRSTAHKHYS